MRNAFPLLLVLSLGCSRPEAQNPRQPPRSRASSSFAITGASVAGVQLCSALAEVQKAFPSARDTTLYGEGVGPGWPSKIAQLSTNEELIFESSWVDTVHVWRISTNSPHGHTRSGVHVGSTVAVVLATGDSLSFEYPEGILAITATPDSVGFEVDDSAAARFWRHFDYHGDPLHVLDRMATIKTISVGADCRRGKATA